MLRVDYGMRSLYPPPPVYVAPRRATAVPIQWGEPAAASRVVTVVPGALSLYLAQSRLQARLVQLAAKTERRHSMDVNPDHNSAEGETHPNPAIEIARFFATVLPPEAR